MKKTLILSLLALGAIANAQTRRIAFEGAHPLRKFDLQELGPDFPSDWSAFHQNLVSERRAMYSRHWEKRTSRHAAVPLRSPRGTP